MNAYIVQFDGWAVVEAHTPEDAAQLALSRANWDDYAVSSVLNVELEAAARERIEKAES